VARPEKRTVDYFPHDAVPGKTIFILQSRFSNNGYAVWFKLLALLCRTPGHCFDARKPADWQFLVAEMALSPPETELILDCLAELDAIDPELWSHRLIWATNLLPRIADAYKDRKGKLPVKPAINAVSPTINPIKPLDNTQKKLKENKKETTKESSFNASNDFSLKVSDRFTSDADFATYRALTVKEFPDLDIQEEFIKFSLWWAEGKKKLVRPKTAWHNWLIKARQIKQEGNSLHNGKKDKFGDGWTV
jgi:hypothetical protein